MSKVGQYFYELEEEERDLAELQTGSRIIETDLLTQSEAPVERKIC